MTPRQNLMSPRGASHANQGKNQSCDSRLEERGQFDRAEEGEGRGQLIEAATRPRPKWKAQTKGNKLPLGHPNRESYFHIESWLQEREERERKKETRTQGTHTLAS